MRPALLAAAFAVILLLALWVVPRGAENRGANAVYPEGWQATADTLQRKLAALEAELAEERHARQLLASDIELLREMLGEAGGEITLAALAAGMEGDASQDVFAEDRTDSDLESPDDETDEEAGGEDEAAESDNGRDKPVFQFDELIAAGVDELEAEHESSTPSPVRSRAWLTDLDTEKTRVGPVRDGVTHEPASGPSKANRDRGSGPKCWDRFGATRCLVRLGVVPGVDETSNR